MYIPKLILHEFFCEHRLNSASISIMYICDILENLDFSVNNIIVYEHVINIIIGKLNYSACLRVDRINKIFEICDDSSFMPINGNWGDIISYLIEQKD